MIKAFLLDIKGDVKRIALWVMVALTATASLWLIPWGSSGGDMLSALSAIFVGILVMVHIMRRLMLPQIQLMAVARRACETGIGAGIVFASTIFLVCVLILSFVWLWK